MKNLVMAATALAVAGMGLAAPVEAQSAQSRPGSMLWVVHPEPVASAPATARIDLAVESVASSATGARSASELAVQRVVRALAASGIAVDEVRTLGTYLIPEYVRTEVVPTTTIRDERRIIGYRAVSGIMVRTPDTRRVGLLVDIARGAGANRVRGVQWLPEPPGGE